MKHFKACGRLLRLLFHVAQGLWVVALRFPALSPAQQQARVQAWSLALLAHAGVSLSIRGAPALVGPVLLENSKGSLIRATFEVLYVDACAYYRIRHDGRCHLVSKCISKSIATETFVCHMPQGDYYFHLNGK